MLRAIDRRRVLASLWMQVQLVAVSVLTAPQHHNTLQLAAPNTHAAMNDAQLVGAGCGGCALFLLVALWCLLSERKKIIEMATPLLSYVCLARSSRRARGTHSHTHTCAGAFTGTSHQSTA